MKKEEALGLAGILGLSGCAVVSHTEESPASATYETPKQTDATVAKPPKDQTSAAPPVAQPVSPVVAPTAQLVQPPAAPATPEIPQVAPTVDVQPQADPVLPEVTPDVQPNPIVPTPGSHTEQPPKQSPTPQVDGGIDGLLLGAGVVGSLALVTVGAYASRSVYNHGFMQGFAVPVANGLTAIAKGVGSGAVGLYRSLENRLGPVYHGAKKGLRKAATGVSAAGTYVKEHGGPKLASAKEKLAEKGRRAKEALISSTKAAGSKLALAGDTVSRVTGSVKRTYSDAKPHVRAKLQSLTSTTGNAINGAWHSAVDGVKNAGSALKQRASARLQKILPSTGKITRRKFNWSLSAPEPGVFNMPKAYNGKLKITEVPLDQRNYKFDLKNFYPNAIRIESPDTVKIGMVSDAHAVEQGLEAVFEDMDEKYEPEFTVFMGDAVGYGGAPEGVLNRIYARKRLKPMAVIAGNHDRAVLGMEDYQNAGGNAKATGSWDLTKEVLRDIDREYLESIKNHTGVIVEVKVGNGDLKQFVFVHGTLCDPNGVGWKNHMDYVQFNEGNNVGRQIILGQDVDGVFNGHTHEQYIHQENGVVIGSPGSSGLPRRGDKIGKGGEYAVLIVGEDGGDIKLEDEVRFDYEAAKEDLAGLCKGLRDKKGKVTFDDDNMEGSLVYRKIGRELKATY